MVYVRRKNTVGGGIEACVVAMVRYREAVGLYARGEDVHMVVFGIVMVVHEIRLSAISGFRHKLTGKVGQLISLHPQSLSRRRCGTETALFWCCRISLLVTLIVFYRFTGLRYSDVANLRRSDVKENHIEVTTVKTKALSLRIPPNVVMKWIGHSDYKAMKPYIDIADSMKVDAMSRFD